MMQAAILAAAGLITRVIGLLYGVPLTRIIGDLGNGYYSTAYNLYVIILMVASYGIPTAVSKIISAKLVLKEYKNAYRILKCSLFYVILMGGIAALITFKFAPYLVEAREVVPALKVLAPTIFFSGLLSVFRGYMQAHGTMIPTSVSQICEQIVNACVSVGAAYFLSTSVVALTSAEANAPQMYGAAGAAMGTGAGVVTALLVVFIFFSKNFKNERKLVAADTKKEDSYGTIMKMLILMVTPVILSTLLYNISTVLDMKFFYMVMDMKNVPDVEYITLYGIFARKYTVLVNVPIALATAMSSAMIPGISGSFELGDKKGACEKLARALRFTMTISIPAAVGMAVLSKPIMDLLFPGSRPVAYRLLTLGAITVLFYGVSTVTNGALQGIGKVNIPMINSAISLVVHLIFMIVILYITDLQLYGILLATILYSGMMCVLNQRAIRKYLGYKQEFKQTFFEPILASVVMGAVTFFSYRLVYMICPSNALSMMVSVIFSVVIYFIMLLKVGSFTEDELKAFPKGGLIVRIAKKLKLI